MVQASKIDTCDNRPMIKGGGIKIQISFTISFVAMVSPDLEKIR